MRINIILLIFLGFSTLVIGQKEWKTYENDDYSCQYPMDWEIDESGLMGTIFVVFAPLSSPADRFKENVNLISQDLKGLDITMDQYVELSLGQIKVVIPNYKLISSERIKSDQGVFHKIHYTGDQGPFNLTFEQFLFIENETAFVITFTTEQDQFDTYKEEGEAILQSFGLK